jgi:hypothetical protein
MKKKPEVKNLVSDSLETVGHEIAIKRVVGGGDIKIEHKKIEKRRAEMQHM